MPEYQAASKRGLLAKLTGEERLLIASWMNEAFREGILSAFPPGLSRAETQRRLYECMYGEPLPADFPLPPD